MQVAPTSLQQQLAAESLYRDANSLLYADNKPSEEAIDRVIGKINKEYAPTSKFHVPNSTYHPVSTRRANSRANVTTKTRAMSRISTSATASSTRRQASLLACSCSTRLTPFPAHPDCALLRQVYRRDPCQLRAWYGSVRPRRFSSLLVRAPDMYFVFLPCSCTVLYLRHSLMPTLVLDRVNVDRCIARASHGHEQPQSSRTVGPLAHPRRGCPPE